MIMFTLSNPGVMDSMLRKLQQKVSEVVVSAHGLFYMLTNLWSPVWIDFKNKPVDPAESSAGLTLLPSVFFMH